jgi:hypothetical protein
VYFGEPPGNPRTKIGKIPQITLTFEKEGGEIIHIAVNFQSNQKLCYKLDYIQGHAIC